jgi:magnesium-transporting ATPase (P-type)
MKYQKDIVVGDFVLCQQDETFPADLVLLASSREDGMCFIATSSLDGEKTLKKRFQAKNINQVFPNHLKSEEKFCLIDGICECLLPNKNLEYFSGQIKINGQFYSLTEK